MPRQAIDALVEDRLSPDAGGRLVDLRVDLMSCTCPKCIAAGAPRAQEHFLTAGGRWDRARKAFVGGAETSRRVLLQPAQFEAARWYARWLRARQRGEHVLGPDGTPCFTMGLVGGRRSGKTYLSPALNLSYALAFPFSITWIIIPDFPDMPEVQREVEAQLPDGWFTWRGEPWYTWTLASGSTIEVRSGHRPRDLKRGRCDVAVIHEAQNQKPEVFHTVAPAQADRGGLTIVVANPPDRAEGEWVEDFVERARAGKTDEVVFELDAKLNPHVDHAALEALAKKMDERTFRREIRGEFLPREDVVMHAFSPSPLYGNVREPPPITEDITPEFTRRVLGQPYEKGHACDFQLTPHMAAVQWRIFRNPAAPRDLERALLWFVDAVVVERGTEDELIDAMEDPHYGGLPSDAVIGDASGEWQDAERTKGGSSFDRFRTRGWRKLYTPDPKTKKNPPISERLKAMNALWKSAAGERRAFVSPHAQVLIRALRRWRNTSGGFPHRRADEAHLGDCVSYAAYRLFPRTAPRGPIEVIKIQRPPRRTLEEL